MPQNLYIFVPKGQALSQPQIFPRWKSSTDFLPQTSPGLVSGQQKGFSSTFFLLFNFLYIINTNFLQPI